MKCNEKVISALLAIALSSSMVMPMALAGCKKVESEGTSEVKTVAKIDPEKIRPQDDFFGYVNAASLMASEINAKYSMAGSFFDCYMLIDGQLRSIVDSIVNGDSDTYLPGSNEQMINDYYYQSKNYDAKTSRANAEVRDLVARIDETKSMEELLELNAYIDDHYGVNPYLKWSVSDNFFRVNEYSFTFEGVESIFGMSFKDIADSEYGRAGIDSMVTECLLNYGYSEDEAKERADEFTYLAIDIANCSKDLKMEVRSIQELSDKDVEALGFDANKYVSFYGITNPYGKWLLYAKPQFELICEKLSDPNNLRAFQTWQIVGTVAGLSGYLYFGEDGEVKGEPIFSSNAEVNDDILFSMISNLFGSQLGELYLEYFYSEEKDQKVRELCEDIRSSYREVINNADWLTEDARKALLRKLENLEFITGGLEAHEIDPEDAKIFGSDSWETYKNLNEYKWKKSAELVTHECPRTGSSMNPQEVNACFWVDNVVRITAGISNAPFFDMDADYYTNLGGLGMVIAHEVGHAFDSDCIYWDENGNYDPTWISKEDIDLLNEHAQACINYYNDFTIMDVYHVDGELTLPENYADMGAMECITNLTKTKEDAEKLFVSYATIWSELSSDISAIELLKTDVHSPAIVRVNAILSTCEKFYETYDVKEGDGMYVEPEKRVSRW